MKQVLTLSHARKSYDGKPVLNDVTLSFLSGAKIGVVGPNGMGKSTLLRMMAGLEQPSNGEVGSCPAAVWGSWRRNPFWTWRRPSSATSRTVSPGPGP